MTQHWFVPVLSGSGHRGPEVLEPSRSTRIGGHLPASWNHGLEELLHPSMCQLQALERSLDYLRREPIGLPKSVRRLLTAGEQCSVLLMTNAYTPVVQLGCSRV